MVLLTPVSLDARACAACRWERRTQLNPLTLRMLARSFRSKGWQLRDEKKEVPAQDYFSEARALEDEAREKEEGEKTPAGGNHG